MNKNYDFLRSWTHRIVNDGAQQAVSDDLEQTNADRSDGVELLALRDKIKKNNSIRKLLKKLQSILREAKQERLKLPSTSPKR